MVLKMQAGDCDGCVGGYANTLRKFSEYSSGTEISAWLVTHQLEHELAKGTEQQALGCSSTLMLVMHCKAHLSRGFRLWQQPYLLKKSKSSGPPAHKTAKHHQICRSQKGFLLASLGALLRGLLLSIHRVSLHFRALRDLARHIPSSGRFFDFDALPPPDEAESSQVQGPL